MSSYTMLKNTYKISNIENFFVSYAVNGNIANKEIGTRYGMPDLYPLYNSPVTLPSPLNTRYKYIPEISYIGI